jgi:energy-coupling factor transporter ATP-binding protein EcfA2
VNPDPEEESPFLGREEEAARLRAAILQRESVLIAGPQGIGKTALVTHVLGELPPEARRGTLWVDGIEGLQPLLRELVKELHRAGDSTLHSRLRAERVRTNNFKGWLTQQSASRLKGEIYRATENGRYTVFFDHLPPLTHAMAKVLRELVWMRNTPAYLVARGFGEEDVGRAASLYWAGRHRLALGPLPAAAARELLEISIRRFGLAGMNLDGFCNQILKLSSGNPGAIVNMCSLASQSKYHYGSQIKTQLVYIDYLMNLQGRFALRGELDSRKQYQ